MKRMLLQLLLLIYAASILKPAMPLFADAVAHTFYYAEHVKTVHKENGKFHVHYELVKLNQKTNSGGDSYFKKNSLPDEHFIVKPYLHCIYTALLNNNVKPVLQEIPNVCRKVLIAPPRC